MNRERENMRKYGAPNPSEAAARAIDAHRAKVASDLERAAAARTAERERAIKERFLSGGGTEAGWASEGPAILTEARKRAALDGDDAARRANAQRYG